MSINIARSPAQSLILTPEVTEMVVQGLARNLEELVKPLCPCRFYASKEEEVKHRTWICACDDMQIYKYCPCLLFVNQEGLPIPNTCPKNMKVAKRMGW